MAQTGAYVDLMFAFGHARLGDEAGARELLARAADSLTSSAPDRTTTEQQGKRLSGVVIPRDEPAHQLLLKGYRYRIECAIAGQPHQGGLPPDLVSEIEDLTSRRQAIHQYFVDRLREPVDPYRRWRKQPPVMSRQPESEGEVAAPILVIECPPSLLEIQQLLTSNPRGWSNIMLRLLHHTHRWLRDGLLIETRPVLLDVLLRILKGWRGIHGAQKNDLTHEEWKRLMRLALSAVGRLPVDMALPLLEECFEQLPRITAAFTTTLHFSRPHLEVTEAAVLALATDDFSATPTGLRHRLGEAETDARRQALPQLRARVIEWGERDW
jgi:hypothetical protein